MENYDETSCKETDCGDSYAIRVGTQIASIGQVDDNPLHCEDSMIYAEYQIIQEDKNSNNPLYPNNLVSI